MRERLPYLEEQRPALPGKAPTVFDDIIPLNKVKKFTHKSFPYIKFLLMLYSPTFQNLFYLQTYSNHLSNLLFVLNNQ